MKLILFAVMALSASAAVNWPLSLSSNNRYLVDADTNAFLIHAIHSWQAFTSDSTNAWGTFLSSKTTQGFNTVNIRFIDSYYQDQSGNSNTIVPPANYYGEVPFSDTNNWSTAQQDYFDRMKLFVGIARDNGVYCLLNPAYYGPAGATDRGWWGELAGQATNDIAWYALFLYTNFGGYSNIAWVAGGDRSGADENAAGNTNAWWLFSVLSNKCPHQLQTGHYQAFDTDAYRHFDWVPIRLNASYQNDTPPRSGYAWKMAGNSRSNVALPWFYYDPDYVGENQSTRHHIRSQALWPMTWGAAGWGWGETYMWRAWNWTQATNLNTVYTADQALIYDKFNDYDWWKMVPDYTNLFCSNAVWTTTNKITAAVASDNTFAMAFFPWSNSIAHFYVTNFTETATNGLLVQLWRPDDGTLVTQRTVTVSSDPLVVSNTFPEDALVIFEPVAPGAPAGSGLKKMMNGRLRLSGRIKIGQ